MTPQEIRNKRLKNDFHEMENIRGDVISWKPLKGTKPYIEEYELTINVKTIVDEMPEYSYMQKMKVVLPARYPDVAPEIRMIDKPFPYHPNWYKDGKWCFGTWFMAESLGNHIIRMIKTLQYDKDITNEHSPANRDANIWYKENKNSHLFPCDRSRLPDPSISKKPFKIKKKPTFTITG